MHYRPKFAKLAIVRTPLILIAAGALIVTVLRQVDAAGSPLEAEIAGRRSLGQAFFEHPDLFPQAIEEFQEVVPPWNWSRKKRQERFGRPDKPGQCNS